LDIIIDFNEFKKINIIVKKNFGNIEFHGDGDSTSIRWIYNLTSEYNKLTKSNEKDFSIEAFQKLQNEGFPNSKFSLKYLIKNNSLDVDNNGHQFLNFKSLLKWKKIMKRPKDVVDIQILKNILYNKI
jgi:hypothetical protein